MRGFRPVSLLLAALLMAGACGSSTKVVSTWSAPDARQAPLSRVLVMVPTLDRALRHRAEDDLVKRLPIGSVASYTIIPDSEILNARDYEDEIRKRGFDGVL